mgnify:CR=1 FL=1
MTISIQQYEIKYAWKEVHLSRIIKKDDLFMKVTWIVSFATSNKDFLADTYVL